jgi:hypothetical protein
MTDYIGSQITVDDEYLAKLAPPSRLDHNSTACGDDPCQPYICVRNRYMQIYQLPKKERFGDGEGQDSSWSKYSCY